MDKDNMGFVEVGESYKSQKGDAETCAHTHSHTHSHGDCPHSQLKGNRLLIAIILNIIITLAQVFGAIMSGSLSLLSDAFHNFSDVVALLISWVAAKLSTKKATGNRTFGFKGAEVIAAFINSATLVGISVFIFVEAIERFMNPIAVNSNIVIVLAFLSIILNGASVLLISNDAKKSMNMKSAYLHLLTDMFTSIVVMIGGVCMKFWGVTWIDGVLSILIATYLAVASMKLLISSLKVLMHYTPSWISVKDISSEVKEKIAEVKSIHHVHIWQISDDQVHFEAHVGLNKDVLVSDTSISLNKIKKLLLDRFEINHVIIQFEYEEVCDADLVFDNC